MEIVVISLPSSHEQRAKVVDKLDILNLGFEFFKRRRWAH